MDLKQLSSSTVRWGSKGDPAKVNQTLLKESNQIHIPKAQGIKRGKALASAENRLHQRGYFVGGGFRADPARALLCGVYRASRSMT